LLSVNQGCLDGNRFALLNWVVELLSFLIGLVHFQNGQQHFGLENILKPLLLRVGTGFLGKFKLTVKEAFQLLVPEFYVGITKSLVNQDSFRQNLKYLFEVPLEHLGLDVFQELFLILGLHIESCKSTGDHK
jgi:hypothetical protein